MAEVSGTAEAGQSTERDGEHRVGRGLLSRFIGAVFLILLGGLLVLDQALARANREQAALDTQSTALLAESFVRMHDMMLQRLADLAVARSDAQDSLQSRDEATHWLASMPSVRRAWIVDADGRLVLDISRPNPAPTPGSLSLIDSLDRTPITPPLSITIHRQPGVGGKDSGVIVMRRSFLPASRDSLAQRPESSMRAGLVIEIEALRAFLAQMSPPTRIDARPSPPLATPSPN